MGPHPTPLHPTPSHPIRNRNREKANATYFTTVNCELWFNYKTEGKKVEFLPMLPQFDSQVV